MLDAGYWLLVGAIQWGYRYRGVSTNMVMPSNIAVLDSDGREPLTLVTRQLFHFVSAAPDRFVVRAERIE